MVGAIGGIRAAFTSAITGIRGATDRFAESAATIAHQSVVNYQDTAQFSSQGRALAQKSQAAASGAEKSLEDGLIGEITAKHDLAANVASLRTADEVMATLVKLGARDR
ncbi:MAG: hypothetical protein ABW133_26140 [Polyangiaceae bacterium]